MKKYFVLLGVIVSSLVHAAAEADESKKKEQDFGRLANGIAYVLGRPRAAEQSAPAKKMNCADLARHIQRKDRSGYDVKKDANGAAQISWTHEGPIKLERDFPCGGVSPLHAFEQGEALAARAQERVLALEHCVQESPEYADSHQVKYTLAFLKQKADLWPQCLQVQKEVAAQLQAQENKEREMDDYTRQHGALPDQSPPRGNFFERWFQG